MKQKRRKLTEEELRLIEETERLIELAKSDPEIANATVPENLHKELWRDIREYEAEEAQKKAEERQAELVRFGLLYERQRKRKKYYVVAAIAVLVMALGITSMGGAEKVFETVKRMTLGREQTVVNSDEDVKRENDLSEDAVYEEIEEKYGFYPVKLDYLPEGIEFLEASVGDEIQGIDILFGIKDDVKIVYRIRPNYRDSSYGQDVEDKLIDAYEKVHNNVQFNVSKYLVEDTMYRWTIKFEYKDVSYYLLLMDVEEAEVDMVIEKLYMI